MTKTVMVFEDGKLKSVTEDDRPISITGGTASPPKQTGPIVPGASGQGGYAGGGASPGSAEVGAASGVAWNPDGEMSIQYPTGNQSKTLITGAKAGEVTINVGNIGGGAQRYVGQFKFAEAGGADPDFESVDIYANDKLVIRGGGGIGPTLRFDVGTAEGQIPPSSNVKIKAKLKSSSNGQFWLEQSAHDRGGN